MTVSSLESSDHHVPALGSSSLTTTVALRGHVPRRASLALHTVNLEVLALLSAGILLFGVAALSRLMAMAADVHGRVTAASDLHRVPRALMIKSEPMAAGLVGNDLLLRQIVRRLIERL